MGDQNVVITGMGLVTSLGKNVSQNWENLKQKKTGIACHPQNSRLKPFGYFGSVRDFEVPEGGPRKLQNQMKFLNPSALLGYSAACEAVMTSGVALSKIEPGRRSLCIGTGDHTQTGYEFFFPAIKKAAEKTPDAMSIETLNEACVHEVNPFYLLTSLHNNLFSLLSARFELKGPNATFSTLSPCGLHALEAAARMIRQDHADLALVAGYGNWITEIPLYELRGLGLLSHCREGVASFRPLDRKGNGFIPGEGGAAVLLEAESAAKTRGAMIHGRIKSIVNSMEFGDDRGMEISERISLRSMSMTAEKAGLNFEDLALICPHGNGSRKGDRQELQSIKAFLENVDSDPSITALKPYTGHMGAASDIAEVIMCIKSVQHETTPATLNFEMTPEAFRGLKISNKPILCHGTHFLSVSCGMGGQVSSILIEV